MTRTTLLWLLIIGGAWAADAAPPELGPGEIPAVDVEANVRKMLEASRAPEGVQGPESVSPGVAATEEPVAARRQPAVVPKGSVPPPADGLEPEDYVPLPEETITIRTLGDVETVAKELDDARKRRGTSTRPPAK